MKILIIEDDVNIARLIELELGYEGYQVCVAHEGNQGIDVFKKEGGIGGEANRIGLIARISGNS